MHSSLLVVITCVVIKEFVVADNILNVGSGENGDHKSQTTKKNLDHTFVALIDIVFTDSSKRTCTGSIIHDNVVITAAHCFTIEDKPSIMPELTASFVVIGTKKMFDTGYEQYLPIERVLTHPKFSGWTADLSLVYTFAGMTSDKPGTIISLAGGKTSTHDSNVTVLSWGHMRDIDTKNDRFSTHEKCHDSESVEDKDEDIHNDHRYAKVTAILQSKIRHRSIYETTSIPLIYKKESTIQKREKTFRAQNEAKEKNPIEFLALPKSGSQKTKLISRYLSGEERVTQKPSHRHKHRTSSTSKNNASQDEELMVYDEGTTEPIQDDSKQNHSAMISESELNSFKTYYNWRRKMDSQVITTESNKDIFRHDHSMIPGSELNSFKTHYKNWRRLMGSQQNQLKVEVFSFVNAQTCKKFVDKAITLRFDYSDDNDVVCYAAEDHFISDEDSGAPVVRRGQLVAVTVGGTEIDGDHIAVGMKMSCYCTWISENLPNGGDNFDCCKNCCDVKHKEELEDNLHPSKYRNKYLL